MRYYVMNGPSPHSSMWEKTSNGLNKGQYIGPEELDGVNFTKSAIDSPIIREKILEKFPNLQIPPVTGDTMIVGVQPGDCIICICDPYEKHITPKTETSEGQFIIKKYTTT